MQKVRLRGYEKSQNTEEYYRLRRVTDPVFDRQGDHADVFDKTDTNSHRNDRLKDVSETIARKRGCL